VLELEYREVWQREFTEAERANVQAMVSMAAAVRHDEDCEISEWGSSFQAEARFETFNIAMQNQIIRMLHDGRMWAIEDSQFYKTRSPRLVPLESLNILSVRCRRVMAVSVE